MASAKRVPCNSPHCNIVQDRMKFEMRHFSNTTHIPYYDVPKSHICSYSVDRTSDTALLPRPATRRNPNAWSPEETIDRKYRSQSVGGIPRTPLKKGHCYSSRQSTDRDSIIGDVCQYEYNRKVNLHKRKKKQNAASTISCSTNTGFEEESDIQGSSRSVETKKAIGDTKSISSIEEHEYLQFLLRVTEDIIMNNYILNEDIERVFKQHIELNKNVLDENKMKQHIANLAVELNISDAEPNMIRKTPEVSSSYLNLLCLKTSCQCENSLDDIYSPLAEQNKDFKENLDDVIYCRHSLGRVTECTEPSNSSATVVARISNPNFLNLENSLSESKSEMFVPSNEELGKDLCIRETFSEIIITEKSSPEDSLKDLDIAKETEKTYRIERNEKKITEELYVNRTTTKVDRGTETISSEQHPQKVDVKIQANLPQQKLIEQSVQTSLELILEKPSLTNKSTQSTSIVSNKKCDTQDLKEYSLIINQEKPISEEDLPLSNRTELEGNLNTFLELKLLGDDYDLTPERDTSEKYHFLMTDASTSMVPAVNMTNVDNDNLLLGDLYELQEDNDIQGLTNNRDTYTILLGKKALSCDDDISLNSDYRIYNESPTWMSETSERRYHTNRKFNIIPKINSCSSTSSNSLRT